jgi:putative pyruvate formate lyase activating enzyme
MNPSVISDDRLQRGRQHLRRCMLCEHRCGADREAGQRGPCQADGIARVFKHRVEYGEERELIPSHLFYLSGCDLRCAFCIAEVNAFDPRRGRPLTGEFFRAAVAQGRQQGARTLQWVGGEPTVHIPTILEVMAGCPELPPVVWKSDFHGTPESFALLKGTIAVYLADFKFGNDRCGRRIAGIDDYVRIVTRNLDVARRQGTLIVRHLLLPGHFDCCYRPIVAWLGANLPAVAFSIREGYLPSWRAGAGRYAELARPLDRDDGERARQLASDSGLRIIE